MGAKAIRLGTYTYTLYIFQVSCFEFVPFSPEGQQ